MTVSQVVGKGTSLQAGIDSPVAVVFCERLQVPLKAKRPEFHAYHKHPVLLLPSGPDKIWAL